MLKSKAAVSRTLPNSERGEWNQEVHKLLQLAVTVLVAAHSKGETGTSRSPARMSRLVSEG